MVQYLYPLETLWALTQLSYEARQAERVAGVAVCHRDDGYASTLVIFEKHRIAQIKAASGTSANPYRPSLFFLKEGPIISNLLYGEAVDLLFVHGHGICHPHSYGLATVVGMTHGIPTIGFARELIKGDYEEIHSGSQNMACIALKGIIKAVAITTPRGNKPVYVSQGFGISLKRTVEEYGTWAIRGRVPEPLRLARMHARKYLRKNNGPKT